MERKGNLGWKERDRGGGGGKETKLEGAGELEWKVEKKVRAKHDIDKWTAEQCQSNQPQKTAKPSLSLSNLQQWKCKRNSYSAKC